MKRITTLIIFVLALTQLVSVAHAVVDSLHHDLARAHSFESVVTNVTDDNGTESVSDHSKNCQYNCHNHCHTQVFIGTSSSSIVSNQDAAQAFGDNQLYAGLIHGPDSPPPNIL